MSDRTEIAKRIQAALNKRAEADKELVNALMDYSLGESSITNVIHTSDSQPENDIDLDNDAPVDVVVDADDVPYNPDLHADKDKGTTGGKDKNGRWKMKRNADRAEFNAWRDKHKTSEQAPPPATNDSTPPATNVAPPPPGGKSSTPPGTPPPAAQSDNAATVQFNKDKAQAIHQYKVLTEEFHIDNDDLCEEVAELFKVPSSDDGLVNFSMLNFENTSKLRELWDDRVELYKSFTTKIAEMYQWVGEQSSYVDGALAELYSRYNTESFQGVHYTDLESFGTDFASTYNEYHQWAIDNKRI